MLDETDAEAFRLLPEGGFAWRGRQIGAEAVAEARRNFALSVGSCSFDEPVDDLRALGMPVA